MVNFLPRGASIWGCFAGRRIRQGDSSIGALLLFAANLLRRADEAHWAGIPHRTTSRRLQQRHLTRGAKLLPATNARLSACIPVWALAPARTRPRHRQRRRSIRATFLRATITFGANEIRWTSNRRATIRRCRQRGRSVGALLP